MPVGDAQANTDLVNRYMTPLDLPVPKHTENKLVQHKIWSLRVSIKQ